MGHEVPSASVSALTSAADRLASLADIAELMDDTDTANGFRVEAWVRRLQAMELLDR
jgi:hypothetical protein